MEILLNYEGFCKLQKYINDWISWNKIIENFCDLSLGFATSSLPLKVGMQQWCLLCLKKKKAIKKWTNLPYLLKGLCVYLGFRMHFVIQFCAWTWLCPTCICVGMNNLLLWKQNWSLHWADKRKCTQRGVNKVVDCLLFNDFVVVEKTEPALLTSKSKCNEKEFIMIGCYLYCW